MTLELDVDDDARPAEPRPTGGDLATVFGALPVFGRAVAGYDRFQVDSYVRWAEDELATADREREHLLGQHLRTLAALDEARRLLAHSPGGGELMRVSRRVGSMLAEAADQADDIRAEARGELSAAADHARRVRADAARALAGAEDRAVLLADEADAAAAATRAEADRMLADARAARDRADVEVATRLTEVDRIEEGAAADAARVRQRAAEEAALALLRARAEVVGMLDTGRELRRRADAEAAGARDRLDREAAARRAALLAEVAALEERRAALRAEVALVAGPGTAAPAGRLGVALRRVPDRFRARPGSVRTS